MLLRLVDSAAVLADSLRDLWLRYYVVCSLRTSVEPNDSTELVVRVRAGRGSANKVVNNRPLARVAVTEIRDYEITG